MKSQSSDGLCSLASLILGYLETHPNALNTVEVIAEWWSLEKRVRNVTIEVKRGLDELIAQEFVVAKTGRDGRAISV